MLRRLSLAPLVVVGASIAGGAEPDRLAVKYGFRVCGPSD